MLFKTTKEVAAFAEINSDTNFYSLKSTIRNIEQLHIVTAIGNELYTSLNNAYTLITDENNLSSAHQLLLDQCRCVIGPYLCYYYAPKADVKLSDSGMQRQETGNSKTAYQEQRTDFKQANLREAETALEQLLVFLEDNKTSYPEWLTNRAFKEYRKLFIKSGYEFQENFSSHSPHRNYMAMRSKMVDVEENDIRRAIGSSLFDYLKATDQDPDAIFSVKEAALIIKLKKAIAYFTVSFSIPFLGVRIDDNGLTVSSSNTVTSDEDSKRMSAPDPGIDYLIKQSYQSGQRWLQSALDLLQEFKADFPSWVVPVPDCPVDDETINDCLSGSFGMY